MNGKHKRLNRLLGVIDPLHVRVIALDDGNEVSLIAETGRGPYGSQFIPPLATATGVSEENGATRASQTQDESSYINEYMTALMNDLIIATG